MVHQFGSIESLQQLGNILLMVVGMVITIASVYKVVSLVIWTYRYHSIGQKLVYAHPFVVGAVGIVAIAFGWGDCLAESKEVIGAYRDADKSDQPTDKVIYRDYGVVVRVKQTANGPGYDFKSEVVNHHQMLHPACRGALIGCGIACIAYCCVIAFLRSSPPK